MTNRLLLIAFHFPPTQGSTGVIRTLSFARNLGNYGWEPTILTVKPEAYTDVNPENEKLIPDDLGVIRSAAVDISRRLSFRGKYPSILAMPDRWQSWILTGVIAGLKYIRQMKPAAIMSTYPIASAHCIGYILSRLTGIPWIAELRDPMAQKDYPTDPLTHRAYAALERKIFGHAAKVIVTTPGCRRFYISKFPTYPEKNVQIIANGFDKTYFDGCTVARRERQRIEILHTGVLYPDSRNPEALFQALASLRAKGLVSGPQFRLRLRATGHDEIYRRKLQDLQISDMVSLLPSVPYKQAVSEMLEADGLLLMQAADCNDQIPAKLYEYLYARRPILGLTEPHGDTGMLMKSLGFNCIAQLDSPSAIETVLLEFLQSIRTGTYNVVGDEQLAEFSREHGAKQLAEVLWATIDRNGVQENGAR